MTSIRRPNTAEAPFSTAEGTETVPERCSDGSRGPMPIILDVDTGVDDACALLLAALHPDVELRAVTCVGGNTSVDNVVRNTLKVLDVAGRPDVPVARGAARPPVSYTHLRAHET